MNKKEIIINNLNKLKNIYEKDPSKKWNLKALKNAIYEISKYDKEIISGIQLKNEINGIGEKISLRIDEIISNGFLKEISDYENKKDNNEYNNEYNNPFIDITGVGTVRAKQWLEIGIKNIDELKEAINNKKIKSTHHIDIGLKYYNDFIGSEKVSQVTCFSPVRFNRYQKGQTMRIHCDHIRSLFEGEVKGIPVLSIIINFNDDYKGGDLIFWDDYKVDLGEGDVVVFPSLFLFPHRIEEVTENIRYSGVAWGC